MYIYMYVYSNKVDTKKRQNEKRGDKMLSCLSFDALNQQQFSYDLHYRKGKVKDTCLYKRATCDWCKT